MENIFAKVAYDAFKIYEHYNIDISEVSKEDMTALLDRLEKSESEELVNKL